MLTSLYLKYRDQKSNYYTKSGVPDVNTRQTSLLLSQMVQRIQTVTPFFKKKTLLCPLLKFVHVPFLTLFSPSNSLPCFPLISPSSYHPLACCCLCLFLHLLQLLHRSIPIPEEFLEVKTPKDWRRHTIPTHSWCI